MAHDVKWWRNLSLELCYLEKRWSVSTVFQKAQRLVGQLVSSGAFELYGPLTGDIIWEMFVFLVSR